MKDSALIDPITLTVIISLKLTPQRQDLLDRLEYFKLDTELPDCVDFLVVDDGSKEEDFAKIQAMQSDRLTVIRTGRGYHQDFSLARARNLGAQNARGRFVMFMDADLFPYPGFYNDVIREIEITNMAENVSEFLMLPVIYLTELGYEKLQGLRPDYWKQTFINAMLSDDKSLIEKYSSGTSVIVLDRHYYLARGGQDTDFEGWGYEDYEFATRLIRRNRKFPLPSDWLSMAGNFMTISKYEGWKSAYRLYGDWMASKGIYMFHAPHPIEGTYHRRKDQNLTLLKEKMKEDSTNPDEPHPLPSMSGGVSLLFRKNPFCLQREFAPFLGQILSVSEDLFDDEASFEDYVKVNGVDRVVFSNPYGNERLLNIYKLCRARGIEIVVGERGALPDSVYHDRNGFLVDSSSYNEEYWNRPLNANEESNVSEYIAYIRSGEHALEQQSERRTVPSLRKKLGISRGKKILFVPFQQPNDTVIRYFSGPVGSFESFRKEIARIAANIGDDWCVVYKKHPVEDELAGIDGAIEANDINVYDLLEMADAVALINSGVGIYAMMYGKPLYVFGESWYGHEGLCRVIREHEDAVEVIRAGFDVDYEKVLRFIHYLRFEFYSFGKMTARRVRYQDGTPITATSQINYYELRGWSDGVRRLPTSWSPIAASSQLFDRYRNSWKADAQPKTAKAKTVASPANNVTPASQPKPVNAPKATSVDGLIKEAAIAYSKKNYLEAAKIFDKALEQGGENPACLRWAAEAFYAAGDISSALSRLQRASALIPGNKNVKARISVLKAPAWKRALLPSKAFDMPTVS